MATRVSACGDHLVEPRFGWPRRTTIAADRRSWRVAEGVRDIGVAFLRDPVGTGRVAVPDVPGKVLAEPRNLRAQRRGVAGPPLWIAGKQVLPHRPRERITIEFFVEQQ